MFSVKGPTSVYGTFSGYLDKRLYPGPVAPPLETVTIVASVPAADGWRTDGNGELTFLNVQIAQAPQKFNSLSHISMYVYNDTYNSQAGTGTVGHATTGCQIANPTSYAEGPGFCSGWVIIQPGAQPYPTPSPPVIFVVANGGTNGEEVNICLGASWCNNYPPFQ